jgi:hypothetical protein
MFASATYRRDFAETRTLEALLPNRRVIADDSADAAEAFVQASAADSHLLRLVACAAGATLVLALVSSF